MIRAAVKALVYLSVIWVVAGSWEAMPDAFVRVAEAIRASLLPVGSAPLSGAPSTAGFLASAQGWGSTGVWPLALAVLATFALARLALLVFWVAPVRLDRALGPVRHPFAKLPLRVHLRLQPSRFLVLFMAEGLVLIAALRALPVLALDVVPGPLLWPLPGDWQRAWSEQGTVHLAAAVLGWTLAYAAARWLAGRVRPTFGFVRYQAERRPLARLFVHIVLVCHLPLAAFSATQLAHPLHMLVVAASLGTGLLALLAGQAITLAIEARHDRWLAGLGDADPVRDPGGFSAHELRARSLRFLHPERPELTDPPVLASAAPASRSGAGDNRGSGLEPASDLDLDLELDLDLALEASEAQERPPAAAPPVAEATVPSLLALPEAAAPEVSPVAPERFHENAAMRTLAIGCAHRDAGDAARARALFEEVAAGADGPEAEHARRLIEGLSRRWLWWKLGAGMAVTAVLGALVVTTWQWFALPSTAQTVRLARSAHIHVRKRTVDAVAAVELLGTRYDYSLNTSLDNISGHFINAVVASEDHRYFEHGAAYKLAKFTEAGLLCTLRKLNVFSSHRACAGNSTIPQQLARNLFLSEKRSVVRKLKELLWAIKMEWGLSKELILELYLNRLYLGRGNFGVELAARSYFGKAASQLDAREAAVLAAAIKRPGWNWDENRAAALTRGRLILKLMHRHGYLDAPVALSEGYRPGFGRRPPRKPYLGHLWQWIQADVSRALADLPDADYKVLTTLNAEVEIYAERHLEAEITRLARRGLSVSQGAVVVMRPNGAVLAMVGGVGDDLTARGFNRAKRTRGLHTRPPASAFKPFVYLAALEAGLRPDSPINAAPVRIPMPGSQPPYEPQNYDGRTYGVVSMREGLVRSINTAAVNLLRDEVGFERLFDTLARLGVDTTDFTRQWGVALGASGVSLVEMVGAYGVFANGGRAVQPHAFLAVTTADGKTVWRRDTGRARRVFASADVAQLDDMLRAVVSEGTGQRAAERLEGTPIAGKTGTGDGFVDAWFIGYTPDLVVGVWLGNDVPVAMPGVYGGTAPARVFNRIVRDLAEYTELLAGSAGGSR